MRHTLFVASADLNHALQPMVHQLICCDVPKGKILNLVGTAAQRRAAESHLHAHIIPKLGSLPLTEINTKTVQSFVAYLACGRSARIEQFAVN
jgi:hypothetical protein